MGLFSRKEDKNKTAPKPITGPTPPTPGNIPPAPGVVPPPAPTMLNSNAPQTPKPVVPPAPGVPSTPSFASGSTPNPNVPPTPGAVPPPATPTFGQPSTNAPSFGSNKPTTPSFGSMSPSSGIGANEQEVPQRKFDIFNENQVYVKYDFSKLKIDKLDLSTNPEPRQIRKHIKKLLELQKQLINMEKDLVCRRDFIDKYIFDEKENQKPKILVDLLDGKDPKEIENVNKEETKEENIINESKSSKKDLKQKDEKNTEKKETKSTKSLNEKKQKTSSDEDDIFKSVEEMLSK